MRYTKEQAQQMLRPVFPAYHPMFKAMCRDCGKSKQSNDLLADLGKIGNYVCSKCCFTFYGFDPMNSQSQRDSEELKQYGGFY